MYARHNIHHIKIHHYLPHSLCDKYIPIVELVNGCIDWLAIETSCLRFAYRLIEMKGSKAASQLKYTMQTDSWQKLELSDDLKMKAKLFR